MYGYFPVLQERAEQRAGQLSGGEQQMLAISRALMARPKMMLLDEPSLGLSPKLVKEIFEIIVRINRERGVTVLLVEQNANMALHIADYGYVLEVGRIVMEDTLRAAPREGRHQGVLPRRQGGERARHAALEAEEDVALSRPTAGGAGATWTWRRMSLAGRPRPEAPGASTARTRCRGCSATWSRERGDAGRAMREKHLGIWRAISWREYGERARHVGLGLVALGLRPARRGVDHRRQLPGVALHRPGTLSVGGVTNGIYTTDSAAPGRVHRQRQRHAVLLRRERGAARQDPRGARRAARSS